MLIFVREETGMLVKVAVIRVRLMEVSGVRGGRQVMTVGTPEGKVVVVVVLGRRLVME